MNSKLLSLYGLKYNPFRPDTPTDALFVTPVVDAFCRRVEFGLTDGGFAMITGDPGTGKSVALRVLEHRLRKRPDLVVATLERPVGRASDFYREVGELFGVALQPHNRWGGFKALRARWSEHIQSSLLRPVLIIDEAQEMVSNVLTELRLLASKELDAKLLLCVVFAGDARLPERFRSEELMPLGSRAHPPSRQARARLARRTRRVPRSPSRCRGRTAAHDIRAAHHARRARSRKLSRPHEPRRRATRRRCRTRPRAPRREALHRDLRPSAASAKRREATLIEFEAEPSLVLELIATGRAARAVISIALDDRAETHDERPARRLIAALTRLERAAVDYLAAEAVREHDERQLPHF